MTAWPEAAALALHRFGFGPVGDSIAAIANDPRGALLADLDRPGAGQIAALPSSAEAARAVFDFQAERQAQAKTRAAGQERSRRQRRVDDASSTSMTNVSANMSDTSAAAPVQPPKPAAQSAAAAAATPSERGQGPFRRRGDGADIGFVERLVWFWSNHFCISADKVTGMAGPYEREAIRPHVLGRFADLLLAVESHPAMLFYLDNVQSMGRELGRRHQPRQRAERKSRARNARTAHARRSQRLYASRRHELRQGAHRLDRGFRPFEPDHGGEFAFVKRLHEPGDQIGARQALSRHRRRSRPRRARRSGAASGDGAAHRAKSLRGHFVADEPPPTLVAKLAKTFRTATAISRKSPRRWSRRTNPGRRSGKSSSRRPSGSPASFGSAVRKRSSRSVAS